MIERIKIVFTVPQCTTGRGYEAEAVRCGGIETAMSRVASTMTLHSNYRTSPRLAPLLKLLVGKGLEAYLRHINSCHKARW